MTYPSPGGNSGTMRGYLVQPAGAGPFPVVLVIHENRGLNPYIEDVARRAATEGFLALAPDGLYPAGGYPGNDDDGRNLQAGLDQDKLRTDMVNSARFAKAHPLSTGKLGVTGFCWGGSTTNFLAVTLGADLKAGVPFYGGAADTARVPSIKAPLMIQYAETDERINAMWPAYETALKASNVQYEVYIYPGDPARLPQQLDAALQRALRQAGLGADDGLLQEASGLRCDSSCAGPRSRSWSPAPPRAWWARAWRSISTRSARSWPPMRGWARSASISCIRASGAASAASST